MPGSDTSTSSVVLLGFHTLMPCIPSNQHANWPASCVAHKTARLSWSLIYINKNLQQKMNTTTKLTAGEPQVAHSLLPPRWMV
jgi:hypothetical protein